MALLILGVAFYPLRIGKYQWIVDSAFDVAHIPAVAILYINIQKYLQHVPQPPDTKKFVGTLLTALVFIIVEWLQMSTGRTADVHDIAQGFLGILAGLVYLETTTSSGRYHAVGIVVLVAALQFTASAISRL